jgi:hypothetical protein
VYRNNVIYMLVACPAKYIVLDLQNGRGWKLMQGFTQERGIMNGLC